MDPTHQEEQEVVEKTEEQETQPKENPNFHPHELIVKGLSYSAEDEDVSEYFSKYGTVEGVNILRGYGGRSKGICFVKFSAQEAVDKALEETDLEIIGRKIFIEQTKPRSERPPRRRRDFNNRDGPRRRGRGGGYRRRYDDDDDRDGGYRDGGYRDGGYRDGGYRDGGYRRDNRRNRPTESKVVYVGNLNFRTEEDTLISFFEEIGEVADVRIAFNRNGSVSAYS